MRRQGRVKLMTSLSRDQSAQRRRGAAVRSGPGNSVSLVGAVWRGIKLFQTRS